MATAQEQLLKQAERAEAAKQYLDAASLYERCGEVEHAISAYQKGGDVDRASTLLQSTGRGAQAGALLVSVGQYLKAAAVFEKLKDYKKAAQAYLRANQRERAAALYEKSEAYEDAAKIYASLKNHQRAMQLYAQAGNSAKAQELKALIPAHDRAAEGLLTLDPEMAVATDQYVDSKSLVDSVVGLLRKGRAADAAKLYGNCHEDIGYRIVGAVAGDRAVEMKTAEMFYLAKDFAKSAQVLENLDDPARAALMYEKADDPYLAGEMYARAGNKLKAAEMFEKHGNYQQAAQLYLEVKSFEKAAANFERSVNHFVAGKLYFQLQKMNKSIQLLQKVQKGESEYFDACRMVGEILASNGHLDLAIRKYLEVVQSAELSEKTAPVFYNLGKGLEQKGSAKQALDVYERLLAWDFNYLDVNARAQALQKQASAPQIPLAQVQMQMPLPASATASPDGGQDESEHPAGPQVVAMMGGFDFLKATPLFQELSLSEMKAVYHACDTRHFAAGEVIIPENHVGEALYVLRKGTAQVRTGDKIVARLGPGAPVGEMALVSDTPTSAQVRAESEVDAFCITREHFDKLMDQDDRIALKVYRFLVQMLSERLRLTSANLARAETV